MRHVNKYFFGIIVSAFLIVMILLISGSSNNSYKNKPLASSYSNNNSYAELYVRSPITSQASHIEFAIIVSPASVTFNSYQGYDGQILSTKSYSNTSNSYYNFLKALDSVGFMNSDTNISSPVGHCAFGVTYQYQLYNDSNKIQDSWSSSCNANDTYKGLPLKTFELFKTQVPDYRALTDNLDITTY